MQSLLNILMIGNIFRGMYKASRETKIIYLIFLGVFIVTLLSLIGINTGRTYISYGIIFLAVIQLLFFSKGIRINNKNLYGIILLTVFCITFLISYLYSPATSSEYGLWKLRQFLSLAFIPTLLILLVGKFKQVEIKEIENFIIITCILTSIIVILNFYISGGGNSTNNDWFQRQSVGEVNPIWLSRFLSLGILVIQARRFQKRPIFVFSVSILLFIAALLTGSKTILFFTIPCIVMYKIANGTLSKKIIKNSIFIIVIGLVIWLFLSSFDSDAIMKRFSLESGTVGQRQTMYQVAFKSYIDQGNLFFGNGGATIGESLGFDYIRAYPHNLAIEFLYELGLFGLFIFLLQVVFALILFCKGLRNWLFFAYVLHLLFALTSGDLASNNLIFIFFALYVISEQEKNSLHDNSKRMKSKPSKYVI